MSISHLDAVDRYAGDFDPAEPSETAAETGLSAITPVVRASAAAGIVRASYYAATSRAVQEQLSAAGPLAVVIDVPSVAWISHFESFIVEIGEEKWVTFARKGSNRTRDRPTSGNDEISRALARGQRVVGIAANAATILPSALMAAADVTIRVPPVSPAIVERVLAGLYPGEDVPSIATADLVGLDFDDIVGAMRLRSDARQAAARIRAASQRIGASNSTPAPVLETAYEFGAARTWGLALAEDVKAYLAGQLPWDRVDRGAVMYGEPGNGKSLLAASIAQACGVPLLRSSVSELFSSNDGDLGAVLRAQRAVFGRAAALAQTCYPAPCCVLLIDELDAMPNRATMDQRHAEWWLPIITDLLLLLDNAISGQRSGIIVIGCTNRIHAIDAAILRPGRLERAIEVTKPDVRGVENILRFHLQADLAGEDLSAVAELAVGSTAAEVMEIVRSARRRARAEQRAIVMDDIKTAIIGDGELSPSLLRRISVHEAGHAVAVVALPVDRLKFVEIKVCGRRGGRSVTDGSDDGNESRATIESRVVMTLCARAAERLIIGSYSAGAAGDLADASQYLAIAIASAGLDDDLFSRASPDRALEVARSDPTLRRRIDRWLRRLERRADKLVAERRQAIEAVAACLAEKRRLSGAEVERIVAENPPSTDGPKHGKSKASRSAADATRAAPLPRLHREVGLAQKPGRLSGLTKTA